MNLNYQIPLDELSNLVHTIDDVSQLSDFVEQSYYGVIWESEGQETKRLFSYCINREDVENAILQGP